MLVAMLIPVVLMVLCDALMVGIAFWRHRRQERARKWIEVRVRPAGGSTYVGLIFHGDHSDEEVAVVQNLLTRGGLQPVERK